MKKICKKLLLIFVVFLTTFSLLSCGDTNSTVNSQNKNESSEVKDDIIDYKLNFYVGDNFIKSYKFGKNESVNLVLLADLMNDQLKNCNEKFIIGWCTDKDLLSKPITKIIVDQPYNLYAKLISSYQATMIYYTKSKSIQTKNFIIHYNDITKKVYCDINDGNGYTLNLNLTDGEGTFKNELMEDAYDTATNKLVPKGTIICQGECSFFLNYNISNSLSTIEVKSRYIEIKNAYNSYYANLERNLTMFDNTISNICYNQKAVPSYYELEKECDIYCIK